MAPAGPYKLVTVNTAPERAFRLIGRVTEDVKDKYNIIHAANVDSKRLWNLSCNLICANNHFQLLRESARRSKRSSPTCWYVSPHVLSSESSY
jgi:hypothetical protein